MAAFSYGTVTTITTGAGFVTVPDPVGVSVIVYVRTACTVTAVLPLEVAYAEFPL